MIAIISFMARKKIFLGKHIKKYMKWLDVNEDDFRITRVNSDESKLDREVCRNEARLYRELRC